jgi:hypothetical protein
MASTKGAATGADFDQSVRRRNVPSTAPNGGVVDRVEVDEKKTQVKKVYRSFLDAWATYVSSKLRSGHMLTCSSSEPTIRPGIPGRVGVYHCTSNLHNTGFLHSVIQDWVVTHSNMG